MNGLHAKAIVSGSYNCLASPINSNRVFGNFIKDLVKKWFEVWENGDFQNIPVTEDFKHTSPFGTIDGKA